VQGREIATILVFAHLLGTDKGAPFYNREGGSFSKDYLGWLASRKRKKKKKAGFRRANSEKTSKKGISAFTVSLLRITADVCGE